MYYKQGGKLPFLFIVIPPAILIKQPYAGNNCQYYRQQYKEYFIVTNGDVTAEKGISEKNIQKRLNDILLRFRQGGGPFGNIKVHEIQRIIHVVDMDGVFIPDEAIRREDDCAFRYEDDGIVTSNVDGAIGRNHRKSQILRKLITVEQIGNVPYSVYFVSCNMDHFLFIAKYSYKKWEYNARSIYRISIA